jgi:hypothetical protein
MSSFASMLFPTQIEGHTARSEACQRVSCKSRVSFFE